LAYDNGIAPSPPVTLLVAFRGIEPMAHLVGVALCPTVACGPVPIPVRRSWSKLIRESLFCQPRQCLNKSADPRFFCWVASVPPCILIAPRSAWWFAAMHPATAVGHRRGSARASFPGFRSASCT